MSTTTIVPTTTVPAYLSAPVIEMKATWSGKWTKTPELSLESCSVCCASADLDTATFSHRYGQVKWPWNSTYSESVAKSPIGYWVRVRFYGEDGGLTTAWIGQIASESRSPFGAQNGPAGVQTFTAYGPAQLLRKITVDRAVGKDPESSDTYDIGYLPGLNAWESHHVSAGNRSESPVDGIYYYGGFREWTYKQYIDYLLAEFVNTGDGPEVRLAGQSSILSQFKAPIRWGESITVYEMLRRLIPAKYGIDFGVLTSESGVTINVFSLTGSDVSYGDYTIPANPGKVRLAATASPDYSVVMEQTDEHAFSTICVNGGRVIVCGSARADGEGSQDRLIYDWLDADETDYDDGGGGDAEARDRYRRDRRFASVYTAWFVSKRYFNWGQFSTSDGSFRPSATTHDDYIQARETLTWTPLLAFAEYTDSGIDDNTPDDDPPSYRPPQAWIRTTVVDPDDPEDESLDKDVWLPADKCTPAVGMHAQANILGFRLTCNPNHLLAKDRFTYASKTMHEPIFEYGKVACTLAYRSDSKLSLQRTTPSSAGGVLVIDVPEAEAWVLCANTITGVDDEGEFLTVSRAKELRNDVTLLKPVMAGALARYGYTRYRAKIQRNGLWPWNQLLGQILTAVADGGGINLIGGPITSIHWTAGENPKTVVSAGYAS